MLYFFSAPQVLYFCTVVPNRFIMLGERHFRHILKTYVAYYNSVRCHSSLGNEPLNQAEPPKPEKVIRDDSVECHTLLGGVLRHYQRPAA